MQSEDTVKNPFVVIKPKNFLNACVLWTLIPQYRFRSIFSRKPVYLKKENIQSASLTNSVWTIISANEDYEEILIRAHLDEVEGGFEKNGPQQTSLINLAKKYFYRSPALITVLVCSLIALLSPYIASHFRSSSYLNQFPLYQVYGKDFLSIVNTRLIFWIIFVPSTLAPLLISLFSLYGPFKAKNARIQSVIKVESWLLIVIFVFLLFKLPYVKFLKNADLLFAPLNSPQIEKLILEK